MKNIRNIFFYSGIYGIVALLPQYFMETKTGTDFPPVITHPEFFYGFIGVAIAWQIFFIIISKDPERYRPVMIPSIFEKASFGFAAQILFILGRVHPVVSFLGLIDLFIMCLFIYAYIKTPDNYQTKV